MNKEELVKEISKKTRMAQNQVADILGLTIETIEKTVSDHWSGN